MIPRGESVSLHHCNYFAGLAGLNKIFAFSKAGFSIKKKKKKNMVIKVTGVHHRTSTLLRQSSCDCFATKRTVCNPSLSAQAKAATSDTHGFLISVHSIYSNARTCCPTLVQILPLHEPQPPSEDDLDPSTAAERHVCRLRCD